MGAAGNMSDEISDARALLGRFLDGLRDGSAGEYLGLNQAWAELVGEDIASHSKLIELEHGTLTVLIDHPAWHQALDTRIGRPALIQAINRRYPQLQVRRLQVRIGNLNTQAPVPRPTEPRPPIQPHAPSEASGGQAGAAKPPADPELARRLARLEEAIRDRDGVKSRKQDDGN